MLYHLWSSPLTSKMANIYNYLENLSNYIYYQDYAISLTNTCLDPGLNPTQDYENIQL